MSPQEKCALLGHDWRLAALAGWVVCDRCKACGVCPACLGYRLAGRLIVFCSVHRGTYSPEMFPMRATHPVKIASELCSLPEQGALW